MNSPLEEKLDFRQHCWENRKIRVKLTAQSCSYPLGKSITSKIWGAMKENAGISCVDMNLPEGDAWTLQQYTVVSRDLLSQVWQQRDVNVAQTSSLTAQGYDGGASVTLVNFQAHDATVDHWRVGGTLYLPWCVDPRQVCKVRVHRHTHHLTVDIMEFIGLVTKRDYLCGTHKGAAIKQHRESCLYLQRTLKEGVS